MYVQMLQASVAIAYGSLLGRFWTGSQAFTILKLLFLHCQVESRESYEVSPVCMYFACWVC